jgi:Rrf2 family transcriptional repressor of oqxAB
MIVAAIGKGGGLHLGRAAEQITLRDLYLAVMEDKRILVAREDIPTRCRISANINEFFAEVATDAETAMLDALAGRNIADSLAELLRLDGIRMKRLTIAANAHRANLVANGVKRTLIASYQRVYGYTA